MTLVERRPRWGALGLLGGAALAVAGLLLAGGGGRPAGGPPPAATTTWTTTSAPPPAGPGPTAPRAEARAELRLRSVARDGYEPALQGQRLAVVAGERLWVLDGAGGEQVAYELPGAGVRALVGRRSGVVAAGPALGPAVLVRDPARYPVVPPVTLDRAPAEFALPGSGDDDLWLGRRQEATLDLTRLDLRERRPIERLEVAFAGAAPVPVAVTDAGILLAAPGRAGGRLGIADAASGSIVRVLDGPRTLLAAGGTTAVGLEADPDRPGARRLLLTDLTVGGTRPVAPDGRVATYHPAAAASPDGRVVAVAVTVADSVMGRGRHGLALVDVARARVRSVTALPRWRAGPVWSVDGRFVYGLVELPLDHSRLVVAAWRAGGPGLELFQLPVELRPGGAGVHLAALWPPDLDR